jgi:hypothetical protein
MNIDPSGYYSMAEVSSAMGVRNSLQNMQMDTYFNMGDIITSGDASLGGIPAIAGTTIGLKLLMRFLPKLQKTCKNSFDGQTLVATENGLIPIEDIQIGDKVWAYSEVNQTKSLEEVTHLIRGEGSKELVDITLESGEIITATSNHPFWALNTQEWLDAKELNPDTTLLNLNDENSTIESLRNYTIDTTVYNLTVGNVHTYYVGIDGVLGHNFGCKKYPRPTLDTWSHIFHGGLRRGSPNGIHHYPSAKLHHDDFGIIENYNPRSMRKGFYQAKVYLNGIKKDKATTFFPDDWTQPYIKKIARKAYIQMLKNNSGTMVDLGDILGSRYKNIFLQYKYTNGKLESIFPILRPL